MERISGLWVGLGQGRVLVVNNSVVGIERFLMESLESEVLGGET